MKNSLKQVIITGGGRGIGAATAKAFIESGSHVCILSRTESELAEVAEKLGPNCDYFVVDLSSEKEINRFFSIYDTRYDSLDCVINNAGILKSGDFITQSLEDWDAMYTVNVRSLVQVSQEAFKRMKASGGTVINVSSVSGIVGVEKFPGMSGYVTSKFAVTGLTEALAAEGKPYNITVKGIAPGAVKTKMLKEAFPDFEGGASTEQVAQKILELCTSNTECLQSGETLVFNPNEIS